MGTPDTDSAAAARYELAAGSARQPEQAPASRLDPAVVHSEACPLLDDEGAVWVKPLTGADPLGGLVKRVGVEVHPARSYSCSILRTR